MNIIISILITLILILVVLGVFGMYHRYCKYKAKKNLKQHMNSEPHNMTNINVQSIREEISNYFKQASDVNAEYLTLDIFYDCTMSKLSTETCGKKVLL